MRGLAVISLTHICDNCGLLQRNQGGCETDNGQDESKKYVDNASLGVFDPDPQPHGSCRNIAIHYAQNPGAALQPWCFVIAEVILKRNEPRGQVVSRWVYPRVHLGRAWIRAEYRKFRVAGACI